MIAIVWCALLGHQGSTCNVSLECNVTSWVPQCGPAARPDSTSVHSVAAAPSALLARRTGAGPGPSDRAAAPPAPGRCQCVPRRLYTSGM